MKEISKDVYTALRILNRNGHEAYLVGGAVRNLLLGKKISDYDICTSAHPDIIRKLFDRYPQYRIGEKHGTVVVTVGRTKIDITTYRKDGEYIDHRRPATVDFSEDLLDDLKRRDFTINALCMDKDDRIIDEIKGKADLDKRMIRAIGDPVSRFNEDALRILRALRFMAKLDFRIEKKTKEAMFACKDLLHYIANERKKDELLQILNTNKRQKIINDHLEIFNTFIPFKKIDKKVDVFSDPYYALAYLLSKCEGYDLKKLKFSGKEMGLLKKLIKATDVDIDDDHGFIALLSDHLYKDILEYLCELHGKDLNERYRKLKRYMVNRDSLKLDGEDLMELGYQGKEIRMVQDELIDRIRHQALSNNRRSLIKYLNLK